MRKLACILLLPLCQFLTHSYCLAQPYVKIDSLTFRVEASKCASPTGSNGSRVSTGVKIESERYPGIVTALHGVCGCKQIKVFNIFGESATVEVKFANIDNDIAVLNSESLTARFKGGYKLPASSEAWSLDTVKVLVNGYGQGAWRSTERPVVTFRHALVQLEDILKPELVEGMRKRGSPKPDITILRYTGGAGPGTSGAPVIYNDHLIAIQNGGLGLLGESTCWGIPLTGFEQWPFIKGSELVNDIRYKSISVPYVGELYSIGLETDNESCVAFSGSDLMEIYILPFSNSGSNLKNFVGLERNIGNFIEEKFVDDSLLVLFEGDEQNLPLKNASPARYAIALNADVVLYGYYNLKSFEPNEFRLKYVWKEKLILRGNEKPEIEGEVQIKFQGSLADDLDETVKLGITNLVYYLRGVQYFSNNQFPEAQKMFNQIKDSVGVPQEKYFLQCLIYKELNDNVNYQKSLVSLCQNTPREWRAFSQLNEFYKAQKNSNYNLPRAKLLEAMVECFPDRRKEIYSELIELDGITKNVWVRLSAQKADEPINAERALAHIESLVKLSPEDFIALQGKANLLWELNNQSEALRSIQRTYLMRTRVERWGKIEAAKFDYLEIMVIQVMDQLYTPKEKKHRKKSKNASRHGDRHTSAEKVNDKMEFLRDRMSNHEKESLKEILEDDVAFSTLVTGIAILQSDPEMVIPLLDSAIAIDKSNFFPHLIKARIYEKTDPSGEKSFSELKLCIKLATDNEGLMILTQKFMKEHKLDVKHPQYYHGLEVQFKGHLATN